MANVSLSNEDLTMASLEDLLPSVRKLPVPDKIRLIQIIAEELRFDAEKVQSQDFSIIEPSKNSTDNPTLSVPQNTSLDTTNHDSTPRLSPHLKQWSNSYGTVKPAIKHLYSHELSESKTPQQQLNEIVEDIINQRLFGGAKVVLTGIEENLKESVLLKSLPFFEQNSQTNNPALFRDQSNDFSPSTKKKTNKKKKKNSTRIPKKLKRKK